MVKAMEGRREEVRWDGRILLATQGQVLREEQEE